MNHCSSCGQDSSTGTNFCIKCGAPFAASSPKVFPGRPVISMDPQKWGQTTDYVSQPLNQIQNPQSTQVQPVPPQIQMNRNSDQKNKKLVGVVGAIIAIIALVVFLGQKGSTPSNVSPNDQQYQSEYTPDSSENSQYYSSYDDYPMEYRNAFIDGCAGEGADYNDCVCVLENLEETYSVNELLSYLDSGDTSYMDAAVSNCI